MHTHQTTETRYPVDLVQDTNYPHCLQTFKLSRLASGETQRSYLSEKLSYIVYKFRITISHISRLRVHRIDALMQVGVYLRNVK